MKRSTKILIGVGVVLVLAAAVVIPLWQLGYFSKKASAATAATNGKPPFKPFVPSSTITCDAIDDVNVTANSPTQLSVTVQVPYKACYGSTLLYSIMMDNGANVTSDFNASANYTNFNVNLNGNLTSGSNSGFIDIFVEGSIPKKIFTKRFTITL